MHVDIEAPQFGKSAFSIRTIGMVAVMFLLRLVCAHRSSLGCDHVKENCLEMSLYEYRAFR